MNMSSEIAKVMFAALLSVSMFFAPSFGTKDRAEAATIQWTLNNGSFNDGGTVSGSFVWDTISNTATSWNFAVSGGNTSTFPAATYSNATSTFGDVNIDIATGSDTLMFSIPTPDPSVFRQFRFAVADFALNTPVLNLSLVSNIFTNSSSTSGYGECFNCSPYREGVLGAYLSSSEVPLPAALPLFATGLGVIAFLARRRKRKDAAAVAA